MSLLPSLIRVLLLQISIPPVQFLFPRFYYTDLVGTSMFLVVTFYHLRMYSVFAWCCVFLLFYSWFEFSLCKWFVYMVGRLVFFSLYITLHYFYVGISWYFWLVVCKNFRNLVLLGNHLSSFFLFLFWLYNFYWLSWISPTLI